MIETNLLLWLERRWMFKIYFGLPKLHRILGFDLGAED